MVAKVGKVAYKLDFPEDPSQIHNTFHVSQLRKCVADESVVVPLDDVHVDDRLNYAESLVKILDREIKTL